MYASKNNSIYVEQTQTVDNMLSHKHSIKAEYPNLEAQSITITEFITSFPVVAGDPILVFSSEFPDGLSDVAGTVVDNGDGTWTVPFTAVYVEIPTHVYRYPVISGLPVLEVQTADTPDAIILHETLTYVSATDVEFVGTSDRSGMLIVGDTITISDGITPTDVVLTSFTESGSNAPYTYTCGYAAAIVATEDAIIPSRGTQIAITSVIDEYVGNTPKITINYANTPNNGTETWNAVGRKLTANQGWIITEPFIMDYTEEIVSP